MNELTAVSRRDTSSFYKDYFDMAFEAADMLSIWWQPFLKGVGRTHLELAGLQSRNAQAMLQWGRQVATARQPGDVITANLELTRAIASNCNDAMPRVSVALTKAAEPVAVFELLPLPIKRTRDSMIISGFDRDDQNRSVEWERRVA
mgnify:CR=1 FL=1